MDSLLIDREFLGIPHGLFPTGDAFRILQDSRELARTLYGCLYAIMN